MNSGDRRFLVFGICAVVAVLLVALVNLYQAKTAGPHVTVLSYSEFLDKVERGQIAGVTMTGHSIDGLFTNHGFFRTYAADDPDLVKTLRAKGIAITAIAPPAGGSAWISTLPSLVGMILLVGVALLFLRRMPGMGGRAMGLGKSKAKLLVQSPDRVTFKDVAGVDEAMESLQEIVDFLRDSRKFQRLGGRIPRGVLMVGPPGTGKTLLARAVAGEANVPFYTISGSDFVEMFVGVGASRVRDLFERQRRPRPALSLWMRSTPSAAGGAPASEGGNDEREQTLNQLWSRWTASSLTPELF